MSSSGEDVADRWIDVAMSMVERDEPGPELCDAIVARLRAEGVTALPRRSPRAPLAAAAAALVLAAALWWALAEREAKDQGPAERAGGQAVAAGERGEGEDGDGDGESAGGATWRRFVSTPAVVVEDAAGVAALAPETRSVRVVGCGEPALAALEALAARPQAADLVELEVGAAPDYLQSFGAVPAFPDRGVATVATLRGLRSLTFDDVSVTPQALRGLAALPALSRLRLRSVPVEDAHIEAVAQLEALDEVALVGLHRATPAGYRALARLERLVVLDLAVPWVLWQRASRAAADEPERLAELVVAANAVDDSVVGALAQLPALAELDLMLRRGVTDAGLAALEQLGTLQALVLSGCDVITDDGLARLPSSLRRLELAACPEVGRQWPGQLQRLEVLVLCSNPHVDDEQLARIVSLPRLRVLDLRASQSITRRGSRQLAKATQLEELWLCAAPWLDDDTLRTAARLPRLRELAVAGFGDGTQITGAGLAHLRGLDHLEVLRIPQMRPLSAADLRQLKDLPLRVLDISRNRIRFDAVSPDADALRALWPGIELTAEGVVPE